MVHLLSYANPWNSSNVGVSQNTQGRGGSPNRNRRQPVSSPCGPRARGSPRADLRPSQRCRGRVLRIPRIRPTLVSETTYKTSGLILNTAEELDAPSGALSALKELFGPSRVFSIGPSLQMPGFGHVYTSFPADEVLPWLDSQRENSVLYVAFGSLGTLSHEMSLELAAGLEASGVPFVWVLKPGTEYVSTFLPDGFEERTSGRGMILTEWAPQVRILQHPAVGAFLSHCGWNSTLEVICSGVPLIAWPLASEQFLTARYIHDVAKVGLSVASLKEKKNYIFDGVTRREIELAIRKIQCQREKKTGHHCGSRGRLIFRKSTETSSPDWMMTHSDLPMDPDENICESLTRLIKFYG